MIVGVDVSLSCPVSVFHSLQSTICMMSPFRFLPICFPLFSASFSVVFAFHFVCSLGGCALPGTSPSDTCILVVVALPSGDAYETSQTERQETLTRVVNVMRSIICGWS